MADTSTTVTIQDDPPASALASSTPIKEKPKKWVQFEDEAEPRRKSMEKKSATPPEVLEVKVLPQKSPNPPAVLDTESIHINLSRSYSEPSKSDISPSSSHMTNVDLHDGANGGSVPTSNGVTSTTVPGGVIRQGFANGDIVVTLLPVNTKLPWITPAHFRPELVPEELMAQGLTLTVEDYVQIMELLTNDVRFTLYNVCYKRVLVCWVLTAFIVLLAILFSGVQGLVLFALGILWLVINAAAIFLCMWIKIKLNHNLERCMAHVNRHLIKHKILLGLDDRGKISCHKVNLCFIYFDVNDCIKKLQDYVEREEPDGKGPVNKELTKEERRKKTELEERMDIDDSDIIIQGSQTTRLSRKQERGERLLCRYIQRWGKDYLRRNLDWTLDNTDDTLGNPVNPRHLSSALCPCQYIEQHLAHKPFRDTRAFCPCFSEFLKERGID
uniref:Transmembrane protein C9orf91 homolog n=1 Tax=Cacopsylla melanoneura TaxID=428564 RepID=A0A8D8PUZ9_9HEMI